jgi:Zn-dependent M28 family amino/carboxypeptidase
MRTESRHSAVESHNVLGVLRGSDAALAREHVALSAHLDHLGIGIPKEGDAIYNGAYDNASGTAGILEIARALSGLPRSRRSFLFAAVTGEEEGLLGAESLAHRPPASVAEIVADLNMDMFLTLYPIRDVVAFGGEHSSLGGAVREAAGRLGLEVSPDPFPEEVIFIRSDHYAFVKKGIPSAMLACGLKSADPAVDGGAVLRKWIQTVYHSPKDDAKQGMDFESAARIARLYLLVARDVADDPHRPSWNPGDFFAARFAR